MSSIRWVPFARADGAFNMAADEVLLEAAAAKGMATLRFYGWSSATLSLGYFQAARVREHDANLTGLPWVRRPSGGKTLVHHHELTYALALPAGFSSHWLMRMHRSVILPALNRLGLKGQILAKEKTAEASSASAAAQSRAELAGPLCFCLQTVGDLICAGNKVVGSAQRKHRKSLLQHGAILLAQSEHAPQLPGVKELTGLELSVEALEQAILEAFRQETGWQTCREPWTAEEESEILAKAAGQYRSAAWNEKR